MNILIKKTLSFFYIAILVYLFNSTTISDYANKIFMCFSPLWQITKTFTAPYLFLGLLIFPLLFLLFSLKGNIICKYFCPFGQTLSLLPGNKKTKSLPPLGGFILYAVIIALIFKINTLMLADPFVFFIQLSNLAHANSAFIYILMPLLAISLNAYRKKLWCSGFCPSGLIFNLMAKYAKMFKNIKTSKQEISSISRRKFLIGGVGLASAFMSRNVLAKSLLPEKNILRPPASLSGKKFLNNCVRCGKCISVCPTNALHPSITNGFMSPTLVPKKGYCSEFCNACTKICPTGAIASISLAHKRNFKIGTAKINKLSCVCYKDKQLCLLCVESCPYHAIEAVTIDNVRVPSVNENICIGCGKCENKCPINPTSAIRVFK